MITLSDSQMLPSFENFTICGNLLRQILDPVIEIEIRIA